ncbi:hypothetical protein LSAT2_025564 [Lamellibrachia satsuma]|nr:hypothetical protein LSAT2_025564 [Lamellibrachia satsuma]
MFNGGQKSSTSAKMEAAVEDISNSQPLQYSIFHKVKSVHVSRHLKATGVERLAVATVDEAIHLRHHDISGPVHIFGNTQAWDIHSCLQYNLTPTVWSRYIIKEMALALEGAEDTCSTALNDRAVKTWVFQSTACSLTLLTPQMTLNLPDNNSIYFKKLWSRSGEYVLLSLVTMSSVNGLDSY